MIGFETTLSTAPREAGVVYTKPWMVELVLDLAGYVPERRLAELVALEPSAGDGAFLSAMVRRLVESCERLWGQSPQSNILRPKWRSDGPLECSPRIDPSAVRVPRREKGAEEPHETQETQARGDRQKAMPEGRAFHHGLTTWGS